MILIKGGYLINSRLLKVYNSSPGLQNRHFHVDSIRIFDAGTGIQKNHFFVLFYPVFFS